MTNTFSTIYNNSPNVRNSGLILDCFSQKEVIEKAHIANNIFYDEDLKLQKTGKEIKEKLVIIRIDIEKEKDEHSKNMSEYRKVAILEPVEEFDEYVTDGLYHRISDMPKRYGYDQKYQKPVQLSMPYNSNNQQTVTDEQKEAMKKYNDCAREYVKCCVDLVVINTLLKNLLDSKKVSLSLKQASLFGF